MEFIFRAHESPAEPPTETIPPIHDPPGIHTRRCAPQSNRENGREGLESLRDRDNCIVSYPVPDFHETTQTFQAK
jgi:hypothetical protein